jgi:hypothetical protein
MEKRIYRAVADKGWEPLAQGSQPIVMGSLWSQE